MGKSRCVAVNHRADNGRHRARRTRSHCDWKLVERVGDLFGKWLADRLMFDPLSRIDVANHDFFEPLAEAKAADRIETHDVDHVLAGHSMLPDEGGECVFFPSLSLHFARFFPPIDPSTTSTVTSSGQCAGVFELINRKKLLYLINLIAPENSSINLSADY